MNALWTTCSTCIRSTDNGYKPRWDFCYFCTTHIIPTVSPGPYSIVFSHKVRTQWHASRTTKRYVLYHMYNYSFCLWAEKPISLPFGNISLFNKFYSIDGCPGPVNNSWCCHVLNKSKSNPPTNPFASLTALTERRASYFNYKKYCRYSCQYTESRANPPVTSNNVK